ncbi:SMI1/KNR4 family protein [Pseudomaricurvus sp. HS19]|uniref:SMI1/KNR4 family protein n=1 Tax=Pseudomaricurvus sp. HS19 TaxID=2692626 RepID=UPI00136D6930|nr:SMI1/KNR4 family protein [Pseudomaricurvus sp. HS19]MYM62602.1 SMI1/KNR4 family protein [Pseudomaricurvus sp. HS19]
MQEIVDELHEMAESVPVPLELPDDEQLVDALEQILMPLHPDFREFLLTASDVIYGSLEPVTVADPQSHTYLAEVTATAWDLGMPRDMVVLCECPEGYYCVSLEGEVKLWLRSGDYTEDEWESVWYWVKEVWMES